MAIAIRAATLDDAESIARLVSDLGYDLDDLSKLRGTKLRKLMSNRLEQMSAEYLAQQQRTATEGRLARAR